MSEEFFQHADRLQLSEGAGATTADSGPVNEKFLLKEIMEPHLLFDRIIDELQHILHRFFNLTSSIQFERSNWIYQIQHRIKLVTESNQVDKKGFFIS